MYISENVMIAPGTNTLPELMTIDRALTSEEKNIIRDIETIKAEYQTLLKSNQYGKLGTLNTQLTELRNKLKQSYATANVTTTKQEYDARLVNQLNYRSGESGVKGQEIISGVPNYVIYGGAGLIALLLIYSLTGKK
jgi:hypothetical protein